MKEIDRLKAQLNLALETLRLIGNRVEGAEDISERQELADLANDAVFRIEGHQ